MENEDQDDDRAVPCARQEGRVADRVTAVIFTCLVHFLMQHKVYIDVFYRIVSTYLVHHGYCATAESFARSTGQAFEEELVSIKNRQSKFV